MRRDGDAPPEWCARRGGPESSVYGGRSSIRNLGACLALAVALRKHPSLGATTTHFSGGEERWSTSLGLIFKKLRT
jgi:hypothetical protein